MFELNVDTNSFRLAYVWTAPGVDRFHMNANISEPDLVDYYGEVFRRPLAAGVSAIMCGECDCNEKVKPCRDSQNRLAISLRNTWMVIVRSVP